jgi:hypothetical protein
MTIDLFRFLPWSLQGKRDASDESHNGSAFWTDATQALDETIRERLAFLYFKSYDADMKPRTLTSLDSGNIAIFLNSCKGILDNFDRAVLADCLRIPAVNHSAKPGINQLDWGLCGTVGEIAQIKYLQGRYYIAENKLQDAWDCVVQLYRASSLCFQAGNSEVYLTGMNIRNHCLLLLCEIVGHSPGSTSFARKAIGLTLSTLDPNFFARAFLAPLAFQAIECLKECSVDLTIEDVLHNLLQQFVDSDAVECEPDLGPVEDMSLSKYAPCAGQEAFQSTNLIGTASSATTNLSRLFRLESTAELIGFVCLRCLEALTCPAHAARNRFAALPYSCLPNELADDKNWHAGSGITTIANLVNCLPKTENAIGLLFVSRFAQALCARAKRNGFFWYYPLAQHRGIAAGLSIRVFAAERGCRPHHLEEVVEQGILPAIPVDPFSGESLHYDEGTDIVSGELGEPELQNWMPPVDVSKKLRWRIPVGDDQVDKESIVSSTSP